MLLLCGFVQTCLTLGGPRPVEHGAVRLIAGPRRAMRAGHAGPHCFGASISPDPVAGRIYANLSVAAEVMACLIPTGIRFYCNGGERWTAFRGWALMLICLAVVFLASGGFAISNLNAGIEARAERETSALRDLRAQIANLDKSIASECAKRGDRCRDLERQRADAQAKLSIERDGLKTGADPRPRRSASPPPTSTSFRPARW